MPIDTTKARCMGLALLLCPLTLVGQTVTVPQQTANTTAPVIPAGTTLCFVPKTGGACKTSGNIPLQALTVTVRSQTVPIDLSNYTGPVTCQFSPRGSFVIDPQGTVTVTGLTCSFKATQ